MTAKDVKNYRFLDRLIRMAQQQVDELRSAPILSDKVYGSNPEYPYEKRSFAVDGIDNSLGWWHKAQLDNAISECHRLIIMKTDIEHAASAIEDPTDKLIWRSTMKGKSQTQIAMALNIDQGTVSRRLNSLCEIFSCGSSDA